MDRKFDKFGAALQAARWRKNYFRLQFFKQALDGARRVAEVDRAKAMLAWAAGPSRTLFGLKQIGRRNVRSMAERRALESLTPQGRILFDDLQKAIRALPGTEASAGRGGVDRPGGPAGR